MDRSGARVRAGARPRRPAGCAAARCKPSCAMRESAGTPRRILPGEQTGSQWRPCRGAHAVLAVQRRVFAFDPFAVQQVALRLLHRRRLQAMRAGDGMRIEDRVRGPFRRAPVQHLCPGGPARPSRTRFRRRGVRVRAVAEIKVEVVHAQAPQRRVAGIDAFARQPALGGRGLSTAPKNTLLDTQKPSRGRRRSAIASPITRSASPLA